MIRDKITAMTEIEITADELVGALLKITLSEPVCILDSCNVGQPGSNRLIAGLGPVKLVEITNDDCDKTLEYLSKTVSGDQALIFTISYDLGLKMSGIKTRHEGDDGDFEPDLFCASFDTLIIHDYETQKTSIVGKSEKIHEIQTAILANSGSRTDRNRNLASTVKSNFSKSEYLDAVESIKEQIRLGNTYQTNLTQRLTAKLAPDLDPVVIYEILRHDNPAPFSALIKRLDSTVVSTSPERFFSVDNEWRLISASPIKGTRRRGQSVEEDKRLRQELLASEKDRAENTMIVDLLRNDLGRVCDYGTVNVESLCELIEHTTLFHLVSTVTGALRNGTTLTDILKAVFPCGSITGAPKLSTMKIIDQIETHNRGLSMGAIGYYIPPRWIDGQSACIDLSVAIRTMVIRENIAAFNVGGGIVIDSDPESEYAESLTKAKALLIAIGANAELNAR
ncbi:MAG: anthranilate synthase component I family protein [Pyrinomonadaceae bacterium]